MAAGNYLSQADLATLAARIEAVFLKTSAFNTAIADYYTSAQTDSAIASAIAGVTQFDYEIVQALPQEGEKGVIYLVPNTGSGSNIYDEYLWIVSGDPAVGHFELFGTQELELVEYKGSGTITVTDGTGADAGKKIIAVKYDSDDFTEDATDGLQLSAARKASLAKADSALQSGDVTGSNTITVDSNDSVSVKYSTSDFDSDSTDGLKLSSGVQSSLGRADTAIQSVASSGSTITVTPGQGGTTKNLEVSSTIVSGAAAGATALQPEDIDRIGDTTINALWS